MSHCCDGFPAGSAKCVRQKLRSIVCRNDTYGCCAWDDEGVSRALLNEAGHVDDNKTQQSVDGEEELLTSRCASKDGVR